VRFAFLVGGVLLLATACGGGQPTTTNGPTGAPPSVTGTAPASAAAACTGAAGAPVVVQDFSFGPQTVTVAVGGVVTWTNLGQTNHTVTFDGGPDCGQLAPSATVSRTFDAAGSFAYHCAIHPSMKGTVVVQ
jgi:plastocyanin